MEQVRNRDKVQAYRKKRKKERRLDRQYKQVKIPTHKKIVTNQYFGKVLLSRTIELVKQETYKCKKVN